MSGACEGESEEEDDGRTSSGVIYKIGIYQLAKWVKWCL